MDNKGRRVAVIEWEHEGLHKGDSIVTEFDKAEEPLCEVQRCSFRVSHRLSCPRTVIDPRRVGQRGNKNLGELYETLDVEAAAVARRDRV